jgi:hypothetical protein
MDSGPTSMNYKFVENGSPPLKYIVRFRNILNKAEYLSRCFEFGEFMFESASHADRRINPLANWQPV